MTPLTKLAIVAGLLGAGLLSVMTATPAAAQGALMGNSPWGFSQEASRASIAALIETQKNTTGTTASGTVNGVGYGNACGGGGTAAATANYTCIILNDSYAEIVAGQDSLGDQTADTKTDNGGTALSEVLESLNN